MSRWKHASLFFWVMVASLPCVMATGVCASESDLDPSMLIDTLAREGMGQLLDRLAETDSGDDPMISSLIRIGQLRVKSTDENLPPDQKIPMHDQMVEAMRGLIQAFPDHEQRPLWRTNLASALLYDGLGGIHMYASEFYEFGVPTAEQRKAFTSVVAEAFEHLVQADIRFFHLQAELPRQPDHVAKRVDTGLWDRMIKEYYKAKTPLLLAQAAYYTALLDDDHPYYQDLKNPKIPRQKATIGEERARLLDLCIDRVSGLVADEQDRAGVRQAAQSLTARAMLQAKRQEEATPILDELIDKGQPGLPQLLAQLARVTLLDRQGAVDEAGRLFDRLNDDEFVKTNLLTRLLVVDHEYRLKLAAARALAAPEERRTQIAKAYETYERLLSNRTLGENAVAALRRRIDTRWESMVRPDADLSELPDMVLAAACKQARLDGHEIVIRAEKVEDDDKLFAKLYAQAQPKLERASFISTELLKRKTLLPRVRGIAMFNRAWAHYLMAQGDAEKQAAAADFWTDLAEQLSDQPIAEKAMTLSMAVLHQLHALEPRPQGVVEAYERAASTMFEKFPTIEAADNERVYYAFYVLAPRGAYVEATQLLSKMPKGHTLYFEAQREMLVSLKHVFDAAAAGADQESAGRQISQHARRVIEEAQAVSAEADLQKAKDARRAHGAARLILADLAIARDQTDQAETMLDRFEEIFQDEPDLVREAQAKKIVMTAQVGNLGELVMSAKEMMKLFPDEAAAVIDGVLTDLTKRIDQLRLDAQRAEIQRDKAQKLEQAKSLAKAAQMLAELLLDWAVRQNMEPDDLVPFKLLLAKATRLAGGPEGAINILEPLLEQTPNDIDLIFEMAESQHAMGDEKSMLKAAEYYDRLIGGIPPPFPKIYWQAWLGRLQIMDELNQAVGDIPLRVRALQLVDPNLGGEPYRSEFKRLQLKHTR